MQERKFAGYEWCSISLRLARENTFESHELIRTILDLVRGEHEVDQRDLNPANQIIRASLVTVP